MSGIVKTFLTVIQVSIKGHNLKTSVCDDKDLIIYVFFFFYVRKREVDKKSLKDKNYLFFCLMYKNMIYINNSKKTIHIYILSNKFLLN